MKFLLVLNEILQMRGKEFLSMREHLLLGILLCLPFLGTWTPLIWFNQKMSEAYLPLFFVVIPQGIGERMLLFYFVPLLVFCFGIAQLTVAVWHGVLRSAVAIIRFRCYFDFWPGSEDRTCRKVLSLLAMRAQALDKTYNAVYEKEDWSERQAEAREAFYGALDAATDENLGDFRLKRRDRGYRDYMK